MSWPETKARSGANDIVGCRRSSRNTIEGDKEKNMEELS